MKIYLLRHAKRGHGEMQDTLTDEGLIQAENLREKLKELEIDKVYCSNSIRARKTIEPFLKEFVGESYYTSELEELRLGVFQGKTARELREAIEKSGLCKDKFRPENGENNQDFLIRIKKFVDELKNCNKKNILLSTHSGVIRIIIKLITNLSPEEIPKADFASIFLIEVDDEFRFIGKIFLL